MKISVITPSIRPKYLDIAQECLENQTFQDFEWLVEVDLRNRGYQLPSAWNKLLSRAQGDIIVMYQDCIKIDNDFLEKIANKDHNKKAYTYPLGKVMNFADEKIQWDWRNYFDSRPIEPFQWEIDIASAPKELFYDVGGFDEEFNKGWSWENVEIAYRAEQAGYTFYVDNEIKGLALDHDALEENPFRNKRENNDKRANETRFRAINGDWKLDYLK